MACALMNRDAHAVIYLPELDWAEAWAPADSTSIRVMSAQLVVYDNEQHRHAAVTHGWGAPSVICVGLVSHAMQLAVLPVLPHSV